MGAAPFRSSSQGRCPEQGLEPPKAVGAPVLGPGPTPWETAECGLPFPCTSTSHQDLPPAPPSAQKPLVPWSPAAAGCPGAGPEPPCVPELAALTCPRGVPTWLLFPRTECPMLRAVAGPGRQRGIGSDHRVSLALGGGGWAGAGEYRRLRDDIRPAESTKGPCSNPVYAGWTLPTAGALGPLQEAPRGAGARTNAVSESAQGSPARQTSTW